MNRILTTVLLWLALLGLPLQGIAAAAQTVCAPMARNGSVGMPIAVAVHHHDGQAITMAHADAGHHGAAVKPATTLDASHGGMHKHAPCSACANCCAGALALLPEPRLGPACGNGLPAGAAPLPWLANVVPDGLERPPKRMTA